MAFTARLPLINIPLDALPVATAALDRDAVIVGANRLFERLCGRVQSTGPGQRLADVVVDEDRAAVDEAFRDLPFLAEGGPQRFSIRARRARRPSLWLAIDLARLGPGSIVPCIACLQAIPRPRRVENQSDESGLECDPVAAARDAEPWPPFLMTLSHEFRGPLTAIRGWARLAESGRLPTDKVARALRVIERNAAILADLVENLFDLSRRAAGSLVIDRQPVDLNPLARRVVESTLPAAKHHNVVLTVRGAPATLIVNGDPLRLEQVVRNLVDNAIKFTPTGGHVHVRTGSDGLHAELIVTDNGFGISPDLLPTIFEPFRHDDASVRPSERGLGLGLALVRELVQLHQGDVRALSGGKGQGATFIVRLPLAGNAAAAC